MRPYARHLAAAAIEQALQVRLPQLRRCLGLVQRQLCGGSGWCIDCINDERQQHASRGLGSVTAAALASTSKLAASIKQSGVRGRAHTPACLWKQGSSHYSPACHLPTWVEAKRYVHIDARRVWHLRLRMHAPAQRHQRPQLPQPLLRVPEEGRQRCVDEMHRTHNTATHPSIPA